MKQVNQLQLGDKLLDDSTKLKDLPDDTGDSSVHLSLAHDGQLKVTKATQSQDEHGEPVVQENHDNIVQESRFDAFITRLRNGIADEETTYSLTDVVNMVLELACLCRGAEIASRRSCEEIEEAEAEPTPEPGE